MNYLNFLFGTLICQIIFMSSCASMAYPGPSFSVEERTIPKSVYCKVEYSSTAVVKKVNTLNFFY